MREFLDILARFIVLKEMDNIKWKPVVGYEGLYEVSACGRVRSLDRIAASSSRPAQRLKGRELKPGKASTGYFSVALSRNGKPRSENIHVLVAQAFLGAYPPGKVIDHINGCRTDNRASNLRYVTQLMNSRNINNPASRSKRLGVYQAGNRWVAQINYNGKQRHLGSFGSIEEAAEARARFEQDISWFSDA